MSSFLSDSFGSMLDEIENSEAQQSQMLVRWLQAVESARAAMFELVEIPHLCLQFGECFFSLDMQCVKRAHRYMKQSISKDYYQDIKQELQNSLQTLLTTSQLFFNALKDPSFLLQIKINPLLGQISSTLASYFSSEEAADKLANCLSSTSSINTQTQSAYSQTIKSRKFSQDSQEAQENC